MNMKSTISSALLMRLNFIPAKIGLRRWALACCLGLAFLVPTLSATSVEAQQWTQYFSEEQGSGKAAAHCAGGVDGLKCQGSYCDKVSLHCKAGLVSTDSGQGAPLPFISEESGRNTALCEGNRTVTGMACKGGNCDDIAVYCSATNLEFKNCKWLGYKISEESSYNQYLDGSKFVRGMRCSGKRCDNKEMYVCDGAAEQYDPSTSSASMNWQYGCSGAQKCDLLLEKVITSTDTSEIQSETTFKKHLETTIATSLKTPFPVAPSVDVSVTAGLEHTKRDMNSQISSLQLGIKESCDVPFDFEKYNIETVFQLGAAGEVGGRNFSLKTCRFTCRGDGTPPNYGPTDKRAVGSCRRQLSFDDPTGLLALAPKTPAVVTPTPVTPTAPVTTTPTPTTQTPTTQTPTTVATVTPTPVTPTATVATPPEPTTPAVTVTPETTSTTVTTETPTTVPELPHPELKGFNVNRVLYEGGSFEQTSSGWVESNANGSYSFNEVGRDEWSVYLNDPSRNVQIQLDLWRNMVGYGVDGGPVGDLYSITDAFN